MDGLAWREEAKKSGLPVFPVRIFRGQDDRWKKRPLTARGHLDAAITPAGIDALDWRSANGYGAAMGAFAHSVGWYCLDVDLHKGEGVAEAVAAWMKAHGIPRETRRHKTISGGEHLIYLLPGRFASLPSRAGIVNGLDSRGQGGWAAFGIGYEILDDRPPATLPIAACEEIRRGYSGTMGTGGSAGSAVELPEYTPPDEAATRAKFKRALWFGHRGLRLVWNGERPTGADRSRSGNDHAVSFHLALSGFSADEITFLLLNDYQHGIVARDGITPVALRAAQRSADKAVAYVKGQRAALREEFVKHTEEAAEAFARSIA